MRRRFYAVAAILTAGLLAACGSSNQPEAGTNTQNTEAAGQEAQKSGAAAGQQTQKNGAAGQETQNNEAAGQGAQNNEAAGGKAEKITIWRPQNTQEIEAWWTEMLDSFNKEYQGRYEAIQETFPKSGSDSYSEKINTAVIADNLPDLMLVDGPNVSSYAQNEILVPLDEFVTEEDKKDMLDSCLKQGTVDGKLYAVALWESSVGIYYNKEMLEEAGIEVPETQDQAWTWDELYETAKQLKKEKQFGITLNTNQSQITYYYSPLLEQLGSCLANPEGTKTDGYLNSKESVEVAEFIKRFYDDGIANIEPTSTEFADGGSALWLATSYQISMLQNQYPDLKWGVTYYPVSNDRKEATPTGSWTIGMTKSAGNREGAYALLNYMTNKEANLSGSPASGYLPARYSSTKELTQYREEPYRVFMEQLENNGAPRPRTAVWTTLNSTYNSAISDIILGSDPQKKLDEAAKAVDQEYEMNFAE
ncbi:extracellular solute-binding protein [Clostridium sp. MCC353]|uniref:extracellular solute-binding protein n=1 Tax=Clostridium sp. MCC353 TaxID=2592646 RepID=UPI001C03688A|nr:extracellular solute-binding protein [Clostridium sp. MCC353]